MFRVNQPGVGWFEVSCKVGGFNIVPFVVNGVEDPPAFFEWFPVNYDADGAVNGGVGNEVGDGDGVAFLDFLLRCGLRGGPCVRWGGVLLSVVSFRRRVSVGDSLFDTIDRILDGKRIVDR